MSKTVIYYYISSNGNNPVSDFLDSLNERQQRKILRIITYIEIYGVTTAIPHVKKLTGTLLWEIRILGQDNIRVMYAVPLGNTILLLHGFIKKKQKTPAEDIRISLERLKEWKGRKD